nr:pseudouridine synthase [Marinicella sp. NBU2979]
MFNKPYQVLCQFTDSEGRAHLGDHIQQPGFYAAGRLDYDSEGLLLLTDDGPTQHRISSGQVHKTYVVQVEGLAQAKHLQRLRQGVRVKDYVAQALDIEVLGKKPAWLWPRQPPIRQRKNQPTSWLQLTINQGKNRQVRRMCAAAGLPVLRLLRTQIGDFKLGDLAPGELTWHELT